MSQFQIITCRWHDAEAALRQVRETVFMQEQQVPEELEWDGKDADAIHLLATDNTGRPIGCTRILHNGHIGRMAVLLPWRRQGVGTALLQQAIEIIREIGCREAFLDAQSYAIPFYQRVGFVAEGPEFLDAGIVHRHMHLPL